MMEYQDIAFRALTNNLLRYFVVAGVAFLLFYIIQRRNWNYWKIQSKFPSSSDYRREVMYSMITISIFVLVALIVFASPMNTYTLQYHSIESLGWGYWVLSIIFMIFLHDTYFYWMHRLMHHPKLYRKIHLIHHKSTNPSPWTAYAFHPIEAFIEASILFPIAFIIPFHRSALLTFLIFMILYNVYGHLGFELYPKGFHKTRIGRWINTSVNHNQHHKHFHGNYGLYFLFWDRWLGTLRSDYDQSFEENDLKKSGRQLINS